MRQIKHLIALLFVTCFMLAGCVPGATANSVAEKQLKALEPCIGIVVLRQDLTEFQECAFQAVKEEASSELAEAIEYYVSELDPFTKYRLLKVFDADTPQELGVLIMEWINKQLPQPLTLKNALYGMLGMAKAGTLEPTPDPKDLSDIKDFFKPEVVVLLLSLLTVPLTRVIKNTFNTSGYETIIVNGLLKAASTGITMFLASEATAWYVVVWIAASFALDQAIYLGSVKPEKGT